MVDKTVKIIYNKNKLYEEIDYYFHAHAMCYERLGTGN